MKPTDVSKLHTLSRPAVSPDGGRIVVAVIRPDLDEDDYRGNLWIVPADGSQEPQRLTHGWRDTEPVYSPDGAWLAFLRAEKDGKPQLHVMSTTGGEPWRVGEQPLGAGRPAWSPDSKRIAYAARVPEEGRYGDEPAKERPRRITTLQYRLDNVGFTTDRREHLFVVDPFGEDAEAVQITNGDFDHADVTWSPDGTLLAFASARHDSRDTDLVRDVWVCATDGSGLRCITGGRVVASQPRFTADGTAVCFVAEDPGPDRRSHFAKNVGLWIVATSGHGEPQVITRLTDEERFTLGRSTAIEVAKEGAYVPVENRGGVDLMLVPFDGSEPSVVAGGHRQVDGVAAANGIVVTAVADPSTSGEIVAGDRTLTSFERITGPRPMDEITGTAPDGYPVHGWIVRPAGGGPHPVVLMIHGGPFTQYGWRLLDEAQIYAEAGYAVVMGNPRGHPATGRLMAAISSATSAAGPRTICSPCWMRPLHPTISMPSESGSTAGRMGVS